jgi:hypothetical protein
VALSYLLVAVLALGFYGYAWAVQPNRPQLGAVFDEPPALLPIYDDGMHRTPENSARYDAQTERWGWYGGWYDQFHYARMARSLGRFELPGTQYDPVRREARPGATSREPASYSYGLGYPLVGALFFILGFKGDPFVVPDGLLFAAAALLTLRLGRHWLRPATALLATAALVVAAPFVKYFVMPYSNSLTVVAVLAALNVMVSRRFTVPGGLLVGLAVAFAFLGRYLDGVVVAVLLAPSLVANWRRSWRVALPCLALGGAAVAVMLASQAAAFGDAFTTPYNFVHHGLDQSLSAFSLRAIPSAFVGVFLTGDRSRLFGVEPVLRSAPWLALAPVGLAVLVARRRRVGPVWRPLAWAMVVATASSLMYLAWFFGSTGNLIYWIIRFHAPWFPLYALLAATAVDALLVRLGTLEAAEVGSGAPLDLRTSPPVEEAPVAERAPAFG